MDKHKLRRALRAQRNSLSRRARRAAAHELARRAAPLLLRHRRIGFYLANDGEMDLAPLMNQALWRGKACFLPVVPPRGQRRLWFTRLTDRPVWRHNRFGIAEHWSEQWVRAARLDVLFIPLVGFDARGNRLGMGGGFYDASLAYLGARRAWRKPYRVGVAFECQKVDALPADPWDVPLDAVVTEKRLYRFAPRGMKPAEIGAYSPSSAG
jgi:5-formyltetrahydrofolate cyclo-ligase